MPRSPKPTSVPDAVSSIRKFTLLHLHTLLSYINSDAGIFDFFPSFVFTIIVFSYFSPSEAILENSDLEVVTENVAGPEVGYTSVGPDSPFLHEGVGRLGKPLLF